MWQLQSGQFRWKQRGLEPPEHSAGEASMPGPPAKIKRQEEQ
jgi:hypothetical protein